MRNSDQEEIWTGWLFLRGLGLCYFLFFLSQSLQIEGLIGAEGLLPITSYFQDLTSSHMGFAKVFKPSLFWWFSSDTALYGSCIVGAFSGFLLLVGFLPWIQFVVCWLLALSIVNGGQIFSGHQMDLLLLEAGFIGVLVAPWNLKLFPVSITPKTSIYLGRFLLFKFCFMSGLQKLSGENSWMDVHTIKSLFETLPLPSDLAYLLHQLPWTYILSLAAVVMFIEIVGPFLMFFGSVGKTVFFWMIVGYHGFAMFWGNFGTLNLCAISLAFLVADNNYLEWKFRKVLKKGPWTRASLKFGVLQQTVIYSVAILFVVINVGPFVRLFKLNSILPPEYKKMELYTQGLHLNSFYSFLSYVPKKRNERLFEGTQDLIKWQFYEFHYKPTQKKDDLKFAWFMDWKLDRTLVLASQNRIRDRNLFKKVKLAFRENRKDVMGLLEKVPFSGRAADRIRVLNCRFEFTSLDTKSGDVWARKCNRF